MAQKVMKMASNSKTERAPSAANDLPVALRASSATVLSMSSATADCGDKGSVPERDFGRCQQEVGAWKNMFVDSASSESSDVG